MQLQLAEQVALYDKIATVIDAFSSDRCRFENKYISLTHDSCWVGSEVTVRVHLSFWKYERVLYIDRVNPDNSPSVYSVKCCREGKWMEYLDILYKKASVIVEDRQRIRELKKKQAEEIAFSPIDDSAIFTKAIEMELKKDEKNKK